MGMDDEDVCPVCYATMEWCDICDEYTCFGCSEYGTCECC